MDGEDQPLPLNCILEEDNPVNSRRKSAPALPSPEEAIPPAPPPRLTSQSIPTPSRETSKDQVQANPVKMLRYENMDMFLKNMQQLSYPGKERSLCLSIAWHSFYFNLLFTLFLLDFRKEC